MTVTSYSMGHKTEQIDTEKHIWVYSDTKEYVDDLRPCKKCGKKQVLVKCLIPAELSYTGKERWKNCKIDACIADMVKALNKGGVKTSTSCCGHGNYDGEIWLHDGRKLIIRRKNEYN